MSQLNLYGTDLFGDPIQPPARGKLADEFLVPPFSVLNAREGWWQERKRGWIGLGIKSEVGRGPNLQPQEAEDLGHGLNEYRRQAKDTARTFGSGGPGTMDEQRKAWKNAPRAEDFGTGGVGGGGMCERVAPKTNRLAPGGAGANTAPRGVGAEAGDDVASGTSIFDPVLCELAYRWWCPDGGQVVDPFAGGSVRGVVAAMLGRRYWGCDLRPEQIDANRVQGEAICPDAPPVWVCGDAAEVIASAPPADFVFSCPPYGDLERYSDDPRDLSTMGYPEFVAALNVVVRASCARLRNDRFACFVVGDFRDNRGYYRNFVSDTIGAFRAAGCELYNEAILVTQVGSLPVRVGKQWAASRKLGKTHQNILVFLKGDAKRAAAACQKAATA